MDDCPLQADVIEKNIPNMKKRACSLPSPKGSKRICAFIRLVYI